MRKTWPAALELGAQLGVVVDLAVLDDDDAAVLARDRLVAALEVDDRQPPRGQPGLAVDHLAPAVGPAVPQRRAHRAQHGSGRRPARRRGRCRRSRTCQLSERPERPRQHEPRRLGDDLEVEPQRAVGDVLEVVRELLGPRHLARQAQLGEAGDPGRHDQALPVGGDLRRELLEEQRPDRARADDAHLAAQHVPELRQLVELGGAQDPPDARLLARGQPRQLLAVEATRCASRPAARSVRNLTIVKIAPPWPTRAPR